MFLFCLNDCAVIMYDDNIYQQIEGLQMGSPLAPILSDLILEKLFNTCLPKFNTKPTIFKKYVDDILLSLPESHIDATLSAVNSFHKKIQFTVEIEHNHQLPYLDMKLSRHNNKITTN